MKIKHLSPILHGVTVSNVVRILPHSRMDIVFSGVIYIEDLSTSCTNVRQESGPLFTSLIPNRFCIRMTDGAFNKKLEESTGDYTEFLVAIGLGQRKRTA